jgi:hypothetical protein
VVDDFTEVIVVELGRRAWGPADEIVESEDQPGSSATALSIAASTSATSVFNPLIDHPRRV